MGIGQGTLGQPKYQNWGDYGPADGRPTTQVGRPPRSADQAHGPHRLNFDAWQLLTSSQGRFQGIEPLIPAESTMVTPYK